MGVPPAPRALLCNFGRARKRKKRAGYDGKGSITQREPLRTREADKVKFIYYGEATSLGRRQYEDVWGRGLKNRLGQEVKGTATEYVANVAGSLYSAKLIVLREN